MKWLGLLFMLIAPIAPAHDGHGLSGTHWHATDTVGYMLIALIVGAALWVSRRK